MRLRERAARWTVVGGTVLLSACGSGQTAGDGDQEETEAEVDAERFEAISDDADAPDAEFRAEVEPEDAGADAEDGEDAPAPGTWVATFGDTLRDEPGAIVAAPGGGGTVAGIVYAHGAGYVLALLEFDRTGAIVRTRYLRAEGAVDIQGLAATADGGLVIAGRVHVSDDIGYDAWIVRLDAAREIRWQRRIGGVLHDRATSAVELPDGSLIVVGNTGSFGSGYNDVWVQHWSADGDLLRQWVAGGAGYDEANAIVRTTSGRVIVVGETASFGSGSSDVWLLGLDAGADLVWQKAIGRRDADVGRAATRAAGGGVYVAASTLSLGVGFVDVLLLKVDDSGNILWQRTLGGRQSEAPGAVMEAADGSVVMAGRTSSFGAGADDAWMAAWSPTGEVLWQRALGSAGSETGFALAASDDGHILFAGTSNLLGEGATDWLLARLSADGRVAACDRLADTAAVSIVADAVAIETAATPTDVTATVVEGGGEAWIYEDDAVFVCPDG